MPANNTYCSRPGLHFAAFIPLLPNLQIPHDWRPAIATPVAKAVHTADPNLFRPISLTFAACKVVEAIVKEKTLADLSQFPLLTSRQHDFLPRRSTLTNLFLAD